jgi:penicillin amidase
MAVLDRLAAAVARAAGEAAEEKTAIATLSRRLALPAPAGHASNAIVVSGRLTRSGAPILLGGPQTGLNIPNFFWEVGLHAPDSDVHGVAVPGAPGIAMGRTSRFAYSITSSADDDSDIFAELLDPAAPGHYLHRGRSLPLRAAQRGHRGRRPATRHAGVPAHVHGPVIFVDEAAGVAFARRRALDGRVSKAGGELLKLALADSLDGFLRIARRVEAGFNLHYADIDGNIAYVHAGRRPRRPPHTDPRLPLLGTGEAGVARRLQAAAGGRQSSVWRHPQLEQQAGAGWPAGISASSGGRSIGSSG